jgi:Ca-activated chloride channel family protein
MQVSEHLDEGAINRVLLVTDGLANVGVTNTDEIVSQAAGLHSRGISTSTIGIGADFNEDLLIPMAQSAGGNSWHVERPEDMQRIFSVELEGLVAQFAHTVSLGIVPADGVRLVDLLNDFELNETGRYRLPDLLSGAPLDIVVQLNVPAQGVGARLRLLDLKLGFTPQDSKSAEVVKEALDIEFDTEDAVMRLPLNHEVAKANALLMNARARKEAIRYMDRGDRVQAQGVLVAAMSAIDAMPSIASAPEMRADADSLADLRASLADPSQDKVNRKRLSYGAFLRQRGKAKP